MLCLPFVLLFLSTCRGYFVADCTDPKPVGGLTTARPCGEYGFRCIKGGMEFIICDDVDGDLPAVEHHCQDGTVCDETNPAYCSPEEDVIRTTVGYRRRSVEYLDDEMYLDKVRDGSYDVELNAPAFFDDVDEANDDDSVLGTTTTMTTTTEMFDNSGCITELAPFQCETSGYFAGKSRYKSCIQLHPLLSFR